jgi:hypothetical protein
MNNSSIDWGLVASYIGITLYKTDMLEGNDTGTDTSNLKIQKFEFAKPGTIIVNYYQ